RTLDQNRELAREVAPSWPHEPTAANTQVRRYDFDPFLVRDYLIGEGFGRKDILKPRLFHKLLCDRIDAARRNAAGERDAGRRNSEDAGVKRTTRAASRPLWPRHRT